MKVNVGRLVWQKTGTIRSSERDHTLELIRILYVVVHVNYRACLSLLSDMPPEVQEDLDLIDALAFLDTFGVSILPIQVRLCEDRLTLIQKAIDARQNAYKKTKLVCESYINNTKNKLLKIKI